MARRKPPWPLTANLEIPRDLVMTASTISGSLVLGTESVKKSAGYTSIDVCISPAEGELTVMLLPQLGVHDNYSSDHFRNKY